MGSPPFSKGDVCVSRQRDSDGIAAKPRDRGSQLSLLNSIFENPSQSIIREISRLFEAVAVLIGRDIWHAHTRGEASHGILSRLRLLTNPVRLPPLEMQQSCRGLLSRDQVGAFTAHQSAFLLGPGRPGCGYCQLGWQRSCGCPRSRPRSHQRRHLPLAEGVTPQPPESLQPPEPFDCYI